MQIVIDIPDKWERNIKARDIDNGSLISQKILEAVYDGKILPDKHGDLVDLNDIQNLIIKDGCDDGCGYIDERDLAGLNVIIKR